MAARKSMTRKKRYTRRASWHKKFLEVLRERGIVNQACRAAGIAYHTAYDARDRAIERRSPDATHFDDFASHWDDALQEAIDTAEGEAWRRGIEGVPEPVYYRGRKVGAITRYSDGLLTTILKANRPKKYRDIVEYTHELAPETRAMLEKYYAAIGLQPPTKGKLKS